MKGRNLSVASRASLAVLSAVATLAIVPAAATASAGGAWHDRCAPQTAYVANYGSSTVTPISIRTNTVGPAIPVGSGPFAIAITPDGRTAYVVNDGDPGTVTPISIRTNTAGPAIPTGGYPVAIAITPDGRTAYVANYGSGTVTPISTRTNTAGPAIPVGQYPWAIAITRGRQNRLPVASDLIPPRIAAAPRLRE